MFKQRKLIRLRGYDYSSTGWYYLTICINKRECFLGEIVNGKMRLNDVGKMIDNWWLELIKKFKIILDEYKIMPNHIHGIVIINNKSIFSRGPTHRSAPTSHNINSVGVNLCVDPKNQHADLNVRRQREFLFKIIQWF